MASAVSGLLPSYPQVQQNRGICLVLNNRKIEGYNERLGSKNDVEAVGKGFASIGYEVHVSSIIPGSFEPLADS